MELTSKPLHRPPYACAMTGRDDGTLLDTGIEIAGVDPHLYLRQGIVEEMGKLIGMVPASEVEKLSVQLKGYGEKLRFLERQVDALSQADGVLRDLEPVA